MIVEATTNMAKHATPGGRCSIMIDMDAAGIEAMFSNPARPRLAKLKREGSD